MTNLLTLAQQIEQATEDQQQDMLINAWQMMFPFIDQSAQSARWDSWSKFSRMLSVKAYESAAMMLVPDGTGHDPYWMLKAANPNNPKGCRSEIWVKDKGHPFRGRAATPALALAAACCRAVAQEREPHNA